jgi:hypothetical protein
VFLSCRLGLTPAHYPPVGAHRAVARPGAPNRVQIARVKQAGDLATLNEPDVRATLRAFGLELVSSAKLHNGYSGYNYHCGPPRRPGRAGGGHRAPEGRRGRGRRSAPPQACARESTSRLVPQQNDSSPWGGGANPAPHRKGSADKPVAELEVQLRDAQDANS